MTLKITAAEVQAGDRLYFNGRLYGTADGTVDTYGNLHRDFVNLQEGGSVLLSWDDADHRPSFYVNREA